MGENFANGSELLEDVDMFAIEISTNYNFSLENLQLNSDYLPICIDQTRVYLCLTGIRIL